MTEPHSGSGVTSVLSTLQVLEEVAMRQPIGVSELSRITNMPKSTVQRCLRTLQQAGWLRMVDADRARWGVTAKPLAIGLRAAGQDGLREVAQPYLEQLRDLTDETIHLAVRNNATLIIVSRLDSFRAVRTFVELGTLAPLHATSCGLAILARLDDTEVDTLLERGLQRFTDATIVDRAALRAEIARTKDHGFSTNIASWWRPDVSAIGAAILGRTGTPIAAIAISIPSSRFDPHRVGFLGRAAVETAGEISAALDSP